MRLSFRSIHPDARPKRARPFLIIKDHYAQIKQLADEKSTLA